MMERRARHDRRSKRCMQLRAFRNRDVVHRELCARRKIAGSVPWAHGFVDVLNQRTAEGNVDQLNSTTDREYRNAEMQRSVQQTYFEVVLKAIDAVDGGVRFLTVETRVDIGAAQQQQSVETTNEIRCGFGSQILRRNNQGLATASQN